MKTTFITSHSLFDSLEMRVTRACDSKLAKYATLNVFSSNEAGVESLYDIFTKTLGFDSIRDSKGNEVSVTDGYCKINFWSDRSVSTIRSTLNKPNITRLSSVIFHDPDSSEGHNDENKADFDLLDSGSRPSSHCAERM